MLMEVYVALQSYVYLQQMPRELGENLNETFVQRYHVQEDETKAIDYIQRRVSSLISIDCTIDGQKCPRN